MEAEFLAVSLGFTIDCLAMKSGQSYAYHQISRDSMAELVFLSQFSRYYTMKIAISAVGGSQPLAIVEVSIFERSASYISYPERFA